MNKSGHVDDHMDGHGGQPGSAPGGSAGRSENLQGGPEGAPTGDTQRNGVAGCSLVLHRCWLIIYWLIAGENRL